MSITKYTAKESGSIDLKLTARLSATVGYEVKLNCCHESQTWDAPESDSAEVGEVEIFDVEFFLPCLAKYKKLDMATYRILNWKPIHGFLSKRYYVEDVLHETLNGMPWV